ncbi:hypothetical protein MA16_Dca027174 [Dendrobium catenatum]|uniref:Uncharacterized protein n=1 Tax=Dendrobium catenatum TaxID=906689 RepID=A0A2I0V7Z8_9ASPA|nr:hypothetical protein MA16_Dca027174 [Dendrobium catenatum]
MNKKVRSIHRRIKSFILTSLGVLRNTGTYYVRCMSFIADRLEYEGGDEMHGYSSGNAQLISSRHEELHELIAACAAREALLRSRSVADCHSDFAGELRATQSLILIRGPTSYTLAKRKPALFSA